MNSDLHSKIISGLERISEVFKTLLWEKAKVHGISPIQIQLLLFLVNHKAELCHVSHLAREFNVTKPTISDAVKALGNKGLIEKKYSTVDNRSYTLFISKTGKELIEELESYSFPLRKELASVENEKLASLYATITELIYKLNRSGILSIQRTCLGCIYYERKNKFHYCNLLQTILLDSELRIDCPEYKEKVDR